jgi:hypothetical protein
MNILICGAGYISEATRTVLQRGDRLLILGQTDVFRQVCSLIGCDEPHFPRIYGNSLALGMPTGSGTTGEALLKESLHLVRNTLSWVAASLFERGFCLALVLSTTSLGLVVPTLKEAGISRKSMGQAVLIAATLADFLTLFGITFFILWHQYGLSWRFLLPLPLFAGFVLLLKFGHCGPGGIPIRPRACWPRRMTRNWACAFPWPLLFSLLR